MDPESIPVIYSSFIRGRINPSDLLYRLSRYDLTHEMTNDDFKKRLRLHRTIITEINRYVNLPVHFKKNTSPLLYERYIKEYLYHCAAHGLDYTIFDFNQYVTMLINTHKTVKEQYLQLKDHKSFWALISEINKVMQST